LPLVAASFSLGLIYERVVNDTSFPFICEVQEYVECMRDGAEEDSISSSKDSTYLFAVEQGDQFVGDAKLPAFQCRRYHRVHGFKLCSGISSEIDFGRLNIIMT
jgi:hypothetical protein